MSFSIRRTGDTLEIEGRFDAAHEKEARRVFDEIEESVVVDFRHLKYISSAGLGVLLATQKRLLGSGHALRLINLNPHVDEIFTIAGFRKIFEIGE